MPIHFLTSMVRPACTSNWLSLLTASFGLPGLSWEKILPAGEICLDRFPRTANDISVDSGHYFSVFYLPDSIAATTEQLQAYLSAREASCYHNWEVTCERRQLHELYQAMKVGVMNFGVSRLLKNLLGSGRCFSPSGFSFRGGIGGGRRV